MDLNTSIAAQSYVRAKTALAPGASDAQEAGSASGFLGAVVKSFEETLNAGEQTAKSAMIGGADPHALVQALASSELAVETAVAVRDKVVEAYQEILRMPV